MLYLVRTYLDSAYLRDSAMTANLAANFIRQMLIIGFAVLRHYFFLPFLGLRGLAGFRFPHPGYVILSP
jgi:hypothetical protein